MCVCTLTRFSRIRLFAVLWTVAHKAPLSMGFSRQEYWSGLPCLSPGDFPNPGTEPRSPTLQVGSLPSELPGKPIFLPTFPRLYSCCCWSYPPKPPFSPACDLPSSHLISCQCPAHCSTHNNIKLLTAPHPHSTILLRAIILCLCYSFYLTPSFLIIKLLHGYN